MYFVPLVGGTPAFRLPHHIIGGQYNGKKGNRSGQAANTCG